MSYIDTLISRIRRSMPWSGIAAVKEHLVNEGIATESQAREAAERVRKELNDRRKQR